MHDVAVASSKLVYALVKSTLNLSHVFKFLGSLLQTLHSSVNIPVLCANMYAVLTTCAFVNGVCACAAYSIASSTCVNYVSIGRLMLYGASMIFGVVRSGSLMRA